MVIGQAKRAPHWGVQSRFCILSVCRMSVVCQINSVGGITCGPRACSKSFFGGYEKDRARRRTKGKKRSPDTDDYEKQRLATLKRLKRGVVEEKPKTGEGGR